jgi:hypothetical protein
MGKEEEERKPKQDIEKEYPKWAWVDYKFQDSQFFKEVRQLLAKGLDPKHNLTNEHVTTIDIVSIFWQCQDFQDHQSTSSSRCKERN